MCLNCIGILHWTPFASSWNFHIRFSHSISHSLPCDELLLFSSAQKAAEIIIHLIIHLTIPKGHPTMDAELKTQFICVFQFFLWHKSLLGRLHGLSWYLHELNTQTHYKFSLLIIPECLHHWKVFKILKFDMENENENFFLCQQKKYFFFIEDLRSLKNLNFHRWTDNERIICNDDSIEK